MKKTETIGLIITALFIGLLICMYPETADTLERLYGMLIGFFHGLGSSAAYITVYAAAALLKGAI